jgi:anti-anti-sigma factor
VEWDGKTARVKVEGEVDLHRSTQLQKELMDLMDKGPQKVVLDLGGVPYMDSSGVASLVKLLSRAKKHNVELELVNLQPKVRSIFEITRLSNVFHIRDEE